ncbi:putative lipid-transfer protein DIR1 [Mercurialis annua]|uniref:putative lipid-transfer protein DIR1 n=1 Tax=Mercurialis annua TaxID=3986 RepID=UPI00215FBCEB|nr:putative lipid-transfer protein DIR1 [Mercurialis annua]
MASIRSNVMQFLMLAILVIAMVNIGEAIQVCNVDHFDLLSHCHPVATVTPAPTPTKECCDVVQRTDLPCLCKYKDMLPIFGVEYSRAYEVPSKCGITPPICPE